VTDSVQPCLGEKTRGCIRRCRFLGDKDLSGAMTIIVQAAILRNVPLGLWHQVWPLAGLAVAIVANLAWIGFLVYALAELL
jgi:hypothetical protein